jgi:hypothetical protein
MNNKVKGSRKEKERKRRRRRRRNTSLWCKE